GAFERHARAGEDAGRFAPRGLRLDDGEQRAADTFAAVGAADANSSGLRPVRAGERAWADLGTGDRLAVGALDDGAEELLRRVDLLPFAPFVRGAALELVNLRVALGDHGLAVAVPELAGPVALRKRRGDVVESGRRGVHGGGASADALSGATVNCVTLCSRRKGTS